MSVRLRGTRRRVTDEQKVDLAVAAIGIAIWLFVVALLVEMVGQQ